MNFVKRRWRGRSRGFSHVAMTLEAAAVMGWFVVLVLGEKYLGDAVSARRSAEDKVQQSSVQSAMSYCQGSPSSAIQNGATGNVQVKPNGTLSISQIASIVMGLGLGKEKTWPNYIEPFQGSFSTASSGGVKPHELVGTGTHTFTGDRAMACLERSKDSPIPSIDQYRSSVFDTTIRGYRPSL